MILFLSLFGHMCLPKNFRVIQKPSANFEYAHCVGRLQCMVRVETLTTCARCGWQLWNWKRNLINLNITVTYSGIKFSYDVTMESVHSLIFTGKCSLQVGVVVGSMDCNLQTSFSGRLS